MSKRSILAAAGISILALAGVAQAAGAGDPLLCGGLEATEVGTDRADVFRGTPGTDVFITGDGEDEIHYSGGTDYVCAVAGEETASVLHDAATQSPEASPTATDSTGTLAP